MYDETILEFKTEVMAFESYLFFKELIMDNSIALESSIGTKTKDIIKRVKEFFIRIGRTIKNFIMKYLGKDGKLLNIRAMKLITAKIDLWDTQNSTLLKKVAKYPNLQEVEDFIEKIDKESEKLENDVSIAVLNSPKLADFSYYNKNKLDNLMEFHNKCEKISNSMLEENPYDIGSEEFNVAIALTTLLSTFANTILKVIDKATYKNEKENSKIEFEEPVEGEVIYRD